MLTWTGDKSVVIQDDSAGIYVHRGDLFRDGEWQGDDSLFLRLKPGMTLEIEGVTDLGGFAPVVLARTIVITGTRDLPKPQPMVPSAFFEGSQDAQRIEVRGVVQGFRIHEDEEGVTLLLSANPGRFRAFIRAGKLRIRRVWSMPRCGSSGYNLVGSIHVVRLWSRASSSTTRRIW